MSLEKPEDHQLKVDDWVNRLVYPNLYNPSKSYKPRRDSVTLNLDTRDTMCSFCRKPCLNESLMPYNACSESCEAQLCDQADRAEQGDY